MSAHIQETGEDIPLEARERRTAPIPLTRNLNNNMTNPIISDMRMDGGQFPGMVKESTVWDVYNNEARKVDNELVKDWTASLNFLLVFAAIFAAVLTAFIIESKKMLEQDPTEILVDITIQYFNSIGNQTRNNFTRPDFEPSFEAISINCLLFASLGASLVAALASVVALQWVADYDAAITRGGSSPEDRAKRRQFRHAGVVGWKMGEIIAALPILLYSSVILFWAGAIQWMWTLHYTVGYVVAGGTAIAILFYASTTILAAVYVSAPFRTPLSRGLYWAMTPSASTICQLISRLPFKIGFRRVAALVRPAQIPSLLRDSAVIQWIKKHFLPERTSRYRENKAAEQAPSVASDALAWLAHQLPISVDSHERLLLCVSGILALSTENPPSPSFHHAPWLAILESLSKHFMLQILDHTSSNQDYQGFGILLHCINSPFIRSKIVPDPYYRRNPRNIYYWLQCRLETDGIPYFGEIGHNTITFLLSRDVPVPSLGSRDELAAAWKLIRWRNSIDLLPASYQITDNHIWSEVFSDIARYSPEFLESCLCHFRTWTNVIPYHPSGLSDYAAMFDAIVQQALSRELTIGEALALLHAFASYLIAYQQFLFGETVDKSNVIPQPLTYALAVGLSSQSILATHHVMTLLVVRAAKSLIRAKQSQWMKLVRLMLWISIPKNHGYLNALGSRQGFGDQEALWLWDEIEVSFPGVIVQGAHIEEIARILWPVGNDAVEILNRDAIKHPQSLAYLELLLQCSPHCYTHHMGSQHILFHLYQGAQHYMEMGASIHTVPVRLDNIDWTIENVNPVLAMLARPDSQGLAYFSFGGGMDLTCAGRISAIVNAVKRRPIAFLCLLTDIFATSLWSARLTDQVLILEVVKQAIDFTDEEFATSFLRPMASGLQELWREVSMWLYYYPQGRHVAAETRSICDLIQAKYAARFISSTRQLRLLSCVRSATVAQPAMGWLRMNVEI